MLNFLGSFNYEAQTDHISYFADLMPTLSDLVGIDIAVETDGISFLPTLKGDDESQQKHDYLYWEYPEAGGWRAVRWGDWKAIQRDIRKGNKVIELYNLKKDIQEQNNVSVQHPEIIEQIRGFMEVEHIKPTNKRFEI